jgi:hypothetical protein
LQAPLTRLLPAGLPCLLCCCCFVRTSTLDACSSAALKRLPLVVLVLLLL